MAHAGAGLSSRPASSAPITFMLDTGHPPTMLAVQPGRLSGRDEELAPIGAWACGQFAGGQRWLVMTQCRHAGAGATPCGGRACPVWPKPGQARTARMSQGEPGEWLSRQGAQQPGASMMPRLQAWALATCRAPWHRPLVGRCRPAWPRATLTCVGHAQDSRGVRDGKRLVRKLPAVSAHKTRWSTALRLCHPPSAQCTCERSYLTRLCRWWLPMLAATICQ